MTTHVRTEPVGFETAAGTGGGLLALPAGSEPVPAVLLMPAIAGVNLYVERVAATLAAEGFAALALDYYARDDAPPDLSSREEILAAVARLPDPRVRDEMSGAAAYLRDRPEVASRALGCLGFCIGGAFALFCGADDPELRCAVDFYGQLRYAEPTEEKPVSPLEVADEIGCPLLGHYGDADHLIPAGDVNELRGRLAGKPAEVYLYPGAGHAFHEDFRPEVYRPAAAADAWRRSLVYLHTYLGVASDQAA